MAKVRLFIRTTKKNKLATIRCRLIDGRNIDLFADTRLSTKPEWWSSTNENIKNVTGFEAIKELQGSIKQAYNDKDDFNKELTRLKEHINLKYGKLTETPQKDWLQSCIDVFHNPEINKEHTLFSFINDFISKAPSRNTPKTEKPACYKQIREYERTFYYLKEYAKAKKTDVNFNDVSLDFYHDFVEYLQSKELSKNTVGKKIQTLKIFLNAATDGGINTNFQFKSERFKALSEQADTVYLSELELQRLVDLELKAGSPQDKVRDLFLIGCWTGLRFGDWNKVKSANIAGGKLTIKQGKTGNKIVLPLRPIVTEIMAKYNNVLPQLMTNQKFNKYLKEVVKLAKINDPIEKTITKGGKELTETYDKCELVGTHTARRSFATNLYNSGVPSISIMAATGHKTESSFLKYIRVTPAEHADIIIKHWQEQSQIKVVNLY